MRRVLAVLAVIAVLMVLFWLVDIGEDACAPDNPDRSPTMCVPVSSK